jgi:hypothetical protein
MISTPTENVPTIQIATYMILCTIAVGSASCGRGDAYATIGSPIDGQEAIVGDTVWFQGEVNSKFPLGIELEGDWRWTSDLEGLIGDRPLFVRTDLSPGEHLITLRVINDRGITLRDEARLTIVRAAS